MSDTAMQQLLDLLQSAAPTIAKVLGHGQYGATASLAIAILSSLFGRSATIEPDPLHNLINSINEHPEQNLRIAAAERAFCSALDKSCTEQAHVVV